jgi:hypothetical protein
MHDSRPDPVTILPVLHQRLEFADCVRAAMRETRFDAVAVEVPSSLEATWLRAIERLPAISALLYENAADQTIFLPVQPADPMVEAARAAREAGIPLRCADLDVDGYADYRDAAPDPYAVVRLGLPTVYDLFRRRPRVRDPQDDRREAAMAFHVQELVDEGAERVLLVCGMHHAEGVTRALQAEQAIPLTRPQRKNIRLVHLHPDSLGEVLSEIPFHVAAYESHRAGPPPGPSPVEAPGPGATPATAEPGRSYGPFRVLSGSGRDRDDRAVEAVHRAARTAFETDGDGRRPRPLDRLKLQFELLGSAERELVTAAPDEQVKAWQRFQLARFGRNLALADGALVPDLFNLIAAARGCVSDNYAWEVHRLATSYPEQASSATDLPTARIQADEIFDGVRKLRIHRLIRQPKRPDWRSLLRKRRRDERWPGEWLEGFEGEGICSYPPEDLIVEDFGRYLKRRGKSVLSEERARTVPFSSSVLDGIDVRETIRHWSEGKVFVRELGRAPGDVASVVVIFDEEEDAYPYCQTWLGEHDQESDMAFFCTEPTTGIVGPGICRVTYGGFMLSSPPQRMLDVWTDPDYRIAETRAEVLLLAALDYSREKIVVHVGPKPPRPILQQLAARLGLKIQHLPLGTLSPSTVKRIRVMHVLSGHDKRKIARDFIW